MAGDISGKNQQNRNGALMKEIEELREKNRELQETLNAIRSGEVDAIVIPDGEDRKIYTLEGPDHPYRALVENIREGALTLSRDGTILYANARFAKMVRLPMDRVIGTSILDHICPAYRDIIDEGSGQIQRRSCRSRLLLRQGRGSLPVFFAMNPLSRDKMTKISVIVTDRRVDDKELLEKNEDLKIVNEKLTALTRQLLKSNEMLTAGEQALREKNADLAVTNKELTAISDELRQSNERMAREEERYRELAEKAGSIILRFDKEGRVTYFNEYAEKFFGFPRDEILGRLVVGTIVPAIESGTGRDMSQMARNIINDPEKYHINENENIRKNGERVWIQWANRAIYNPDGSVREFTAIGNDITERKQAEILLAKNHMELNKAYHELGERDRKLSEALREKEILLSEIHHRVKNNLSAFISLLSLEGAYDSTHLGLAMRNDLQNRARSMALIHETLYRTQNFSRVDMQIYFSTLVSQVVSSYEGARPVRTAVEARGVFLDIVRATPAGLIVNELLTNSLKYAWPVGFDAAQVRHEPACFGITLQEADGGYTLTVRDNGIGLPAEIDPAQTKTLGLKLVNFLSRHQLRATTEVQREGGTSFIFRLHDKE